MKTGFDFSFFLCIFTFSNMYFDFISNLLHCIPFYRLDWTDCQTRRLLFEYLHINIYLNNVIFIYICRYFTPHESCTVILSTLNHPQNQRLQKWRQK